METFCRISWWRKQCLCFRFLEMTGGAGQFGEQGRGDWRGAAFVGAVRILLLKLFSELSSSFLPKNWVV